MTFINWIKDYFKGIKNGGKENFKKFVLSAPFWVLLAGIGLIIGFSINAAILYANRYDTRMAEIWSQGSETSFRHVAVYAGGARVGGETSPMVYIDPDHSLKYSDINLMRTSLQAAVDTGITVAKNKGLKDDGSPNGWDDCYSSSLIGTINLAGDNVTKQGIDAEIIGVGGNFKAFHPFEFLSGGFLPKTVVDTNQVVLNDVLAWRFFNSYDVIGNKVVIGDETFTVIGVVAEPNSGIDRDAGTYRARAYIYFSKLGMWLGDSQGSEGSAFLEPSIMCYEAMLPEMVKGVATSDLRAALPSYNAASPSMYVVSVTGRHSILKLWDYMFPVGQTDRMLASYELPYWEVASDITATRLCVDYIFILLGIILVILAIIMLVLKSRKFINITEQ